MNSIIKKHKKLIRLLAIPVLILACFLVYKFFFSGPGAMHGGPAKVVETEVVALGSIEQTISLIGTIKPKYSTTLVARASGILGATLPAGHKVQKGEVIVQIDNADIEKNYNLSESSEKIAKTQYDRIHGLYKSGHFSEQAMEEKKNTWIIAQKALANAKIELEKIRFHAPFDGIVGVFKIREGTQIKEGDHIVSFYDPNSLVVEFAIPSSFIHSIHNGQQVKIAESTYVLNHVQKMIDETTHMGSAYVDISCSECVIGNTIDVELVVQERSNIIVIPFEAVFIRNGQDSVYLVKDGQATLAPVQLGLREKDKVEIGSGLQVGDNLIVRGQARLHPGAAVKVHEK